MILWGIVPGVAILRIATAVEMLFGRSTGGDTLIDIRIPSECVHNGAVVASLQDANMSYFITLLSTERRIPNGMHRRSRRDRPT